MKGSYQHHTLKVGHFLETWSTSSQFVTSSNLNSAIFALTSLTNLGNGQCRGEVHGMNYYAADTFVGIHPNRVRTFSSASRAELRRENDMATWMSEGNYAYKYINHMCHFVKYWPLGRHFYTLNYLKHMKDHWCVISIWMQSSQYAVYGSSPTKIFSRYFIFRAVETFRIYVIQIQLTQNHSSFWLLEITQDPNLSRNIGVLCNHKKPKRGSIHSVRKILSAMWYLQQFNMSSRRESKWSFFSWYPNVVPHIICNCFTSGISMSHWF